MRKEFLEFIDRSTGFPAASDAKGVIINPRTLKMRNIKTSLSLADLNEYRKMLQTLMYSGEANQLSIDFAQNKINLQIYDEIFRDLVLDFIVNHGTPTNSVNLTIGTVEFTKNVFDSFRPSVGGVQVYFGTSTAQNGGGCTLGLPVLIDTIEGYLTGSHCSLTQGTSNDGSALYQAGSIIGNKTLDNALYACVDGGVNVQCQNADTSFYKSTISLTRGRIILASGNTGSLLTTTTATGNDAYYDVTAVAERVPNGDTVYSMGTSSGIRSATVANWNTDVRFPATTTRPAIVIKNVVKVSSTTGASGCSGDSGGPWYQITGLTTAKFAGIRSSSDTQISSITRLDGVLSKCFTNSYFSPVAQIRIAYPNRVFQFTR